MSLKMQRLKAIIVGGSIGGVSCAKALILAGWDVSVIEKSHAPPTLSPTGAGLAVDPLAQKIVASWIHQPELFQELTFPLTIFQNQVTDGEKKVNSVLTRDENFNCVIAYWADLHGLLHNGLPPEIFLWGHQFLSFSISEDKSTVKVKAKVLQTEEIVEIEGDLLVAADGSRSSIRQSFLPDTKLRYSGYCAWRGVLDFSENENSETIQGIRKAYPDLGKCVYTDLGPGTHSLLDELPCKRLNWIWFVNQLEPELKGDSSTMKVGSDMIRIMHQEAEKVWIPELAKVIKETEEPFLNVIHDCDPLPQIFWNNVVLIGDAAHPTTPHCARSTNMAIIDVAVLGKCLEKWGPENLKSALEEYQAIRLPVTSTQVLYSRKVGQIKQGLNLPDRQPFDQKRASPDDCEFFLSKNVPLVIDVPRIFDSMFQI